MAKTSLGGRGIERELGQSHLRNEWRKGYSEKEMLVTIGRWLVMFGLDCEKALRARWAKRWEESERSGRGTWRKRKQVGRVD